VGKIVSDAGADNLQKRSTGQWCSGQSAKNSMPEVGGEKKPPDSLAVFREFRVPYVH
jgi:hypothetical protein